MTAQLNLVTKAYLKFRETKRKIKNRHKRELVEFAKPDLIALGAEISSCRDAGFKVEDIMRVMGLKNRNFLYEALEAYRESTGKPEDVIPELPEPPQNAEESVTVTKDGQSGIIAQIGSQEYRLTVNTRGQITNMPEEWLQSLPSDKLAQVKEVINQTRAMFSPG